LLTRKTQPIPLPLEAKPVASLGAEQVGPVAALALLVIMRPARQEPRNCRIGSTYRDNNPETAA
jgi:hypothetical protein